MLIRKDETVVERVPRPSARNANIGDPFAIKFVGRDFEGVFPYQRLAKVIIKDDILSFFFDNGEFVECEGSNLRAILDSVWTARLQFIEETVERSHASRSLVEGEIIVESLRYCDGAEDSER